MAQVLTRQPFNNANLTQGGVRLLIKELTNGKGLQYIGKIKEPKLEPVLDWYQHEDASSGKSVVDYESPSKIGFKVAFKADEMLRDNLKRLLFAGAPSAVVADPVAEAGPETVVAGKTGELHGLDYGRQTAEQRGDLAVYNVTDPALLVLDTDYEIVTLYGLTFVKMKVDTHAGDVLRFGEGATASDEYHYTELAHNEMAPMTISKLEVGAVVQFPAMKGVNAEWRLWKAVIKPTSVDWLSKEASNIGFELELLDDSAAHPASPFGLFLDYGYDDAGAAII